MIVDKVGEQGRGIMHSVTLTEKGLIDVHVARSEVDIGVGADSLLHGRRIHVSLNPVQFLVTEVSIFRTVTTSSSDLL